MHRREFFQQAGAVLGAASLAALAGPDKGDEPGKPAAKGAFRPGEWTSVRDQFALTRSYVHLATFLLASHPRPVAEAIEKHRRAFDENPAGYWHEHFRTRDALLRAAAAEYMGGSPDFIALTDSTTMGIGMVYAGLHLEPGQEILTTTHDHYSTELALEYRSKRTGAKLVRVPLYDQSARASVDEIVSRMRKAITDRTRVLAVTWVHSSTGVKLPIQAMAAALAEVNASRDLNDRVLFCVDGVHGFGIEDVLIDDLGCDFFMAGTHKWLFGPRGTGVIWARPEAWKVARPFIPSFGANYGVWLGLATPDQVPVGDLMTPGGFHSFEHRWALDKAFRFHLEIGKARVQKRIHQLNTMTKEGLAAMSHVKLYTPASTELSSGIVCFDVAGHTPSQVEAHLHDRKIIASTTPYRESYARLAPSLINNEEEIEQTLKEIGAMA